MKRRVVLTSAAVGALTSISGCSTVSSLVNDASPTVEWNQNFLTWDNREPKFAVTTRVSLDGAGSIEFYRGESDPEGEPFYVIQSSGKHLLAGRRNAPIGPVSSGEIILAAMPGGDEVGAHIVESGDRTPPPRQDSTDEPGSQQGSSGSAETTQEPSGEVPLFLQGLRGSTDPNPETGGFVDRTYTQRIGLGQTILNTRLSEALYDYYTERLRILDYGAYTADGYDERSINSLVDQFRRYASENNLSDRQTINHMMAFVQQLKYAQDKPATGYNEYPKFPIETLYDRGGDCEDTSILLASLLQKFGYGVRLISLPDVNHMALGVAGEDGLPGTYYTANGRRYYYVETTAGGWEIGDMPESVQRNDRAELLPIDSHPMVVFSFAVSVSTDGVVICKGNMKNVGSAPGEVRMQFELQDSQENRVAVGQSSRQPLGTDGTTEVAINVDAPEPQPLRAQVGVLVNGDPHDLTSTEYAEPERT